MNLKCIILAGKIPVYLVTNSMSSPRKEIHASYALDVVSSVGNQCIRKMYIPFAWRIANRLIKALHSTRTFDSVYW
jgi:hypothetical protein